MDSDFGIHNCNTPRAYAAKHKLNDLDMPTYNNALTGEYTHEFESTMIKKIKQLLQKRTLTYIPWLHVPLIDSGRKYQS